MSKNTKTPYPAPKRGLPWELKCKFARGQLTTLFKGVMNEIREKYGAAAALEIAEKAWKREDRVKNMVHTLKDVFKIEGNDIEALGNWWDIYYELAGMEATILERSKTIDRRKLTKCPFVTEHKDVSDWDVRFCKIAAKTINEKAILEMPKTMCAGDPYCDFIFRIEK